MFRYLRAIAIALFGFAGLAGAQAQQLSLPDPVGVARVVAQGGVPTLTGCTIVAGSTDTAGECTATATSGSIAFSRAFLTAPTCIVYDKAATSTVSMPVYTTTTAQITLTTIISGHGLVWTCFGKIGG